MLPVSSNFKDLGLYLFFKPKTKPYTMKKIYAVVGCALFAFGLNAQGILTTPTGGRTPHNTERSNPPATQSQMVIYTDYDFMDEAYNVDSLGGTYTRYIWDMNMNYDLALGDTNISYAVVDFYGSLWDSYNVNGPAVVPNSTFNTYMLDSVFILGGHENNSGQPDTLIIKTVSVNGQGYPQTSNVLDRDTIISMQFGTTNDWLTAAVIGVEVNYAFSSPTTRFAVLVEYYGARNDSFGILAGFGDYGPGNCSSNPNLPNFAVPSHYGDPNSYRLDMRFASYGMLPTATGADTYYECNGTANYQSGQDSENFLQNWGIWVRITLDGLGVEEQGNTGVALSQNTPNPATAGNTLINYGLANNADNVSLEIYDISGQLVQSVNQGQQAAGQHTIDLNTSNLSAGVYFYTLNVDGVKVTKKMVIGE